MRKLNALMLGTALAVAPLAAVAADPQLSEIEVNVELEAATDSNALEFWPTLEADLEARLAQAFADNITTEPTASRLQVNISEVSVDGNALLAGAGEFNTLNGTVALFPPTQDSAGGTDSGVEPPMTAAAGVYAVPELPATLPSDGPVMILSPSDGTVYNVMLDKFTEVVVRRVEAM